MRRLLGVLLAVGAVAALFAMPASAAVQASDPGQLIQTVAAEVTQIVKTRTGTERETAFRGLLKNNFDLPYMASAALGTHWNDASEQQRARFLTAVETSEARAYGERLGLFADATMAIGAVAARSNNVWTVDSTLTLASGQPVKLQWEVRGGGQGLRIADVKVAGVSLFVTRRADFNAYIQSHGGTVEPLVAALEARATR